MMNAAKIRTISETAKHFALFYTAKSESHSRGYIYNNVRATGEKACRQGLSPFFIGEKHNFSPKVLVFLQI